MKLFPFLLLIAILIAPQAYSQNGCNGESPWIPAAQDSGSVEQIFEHNGELHKAGHYGNTRHISRWDGNQWHVITTWNSGFNHTEYLSWNGYIVTCGAFNNMGGTPNTAALAAWDGTNWISLGAFSDGLSTAFLYNMTVWNGNLVVGGHWGNVDGIPCTGIAMHDGTSWSNMNANFTPNWTTNEPYINDFIEYQGNLVVGGAIELSGSTPVNNLAMWDGTNWSAVGTGTDREVNHLQVLGNDLFVHSFYAQNWGGGQNFHSFARWDGTQYNDLGFVQTSANIEDLIVFNGELYLLIHSSSSAELSFGYPVGNSLKWNGGTSWENLGVVEPYPQDYAIVNGELYVGGFMTYTCSESLNGIARLCGDNECGWIEGQVFNDVDFDCDTTGNDGLQGQLINFQPGNRSTLTDVNGEYRIRMLAGNYNGSTTPPNYFNQFCPPSGVQAVSVIAGDTAAGTDFGWTADPNVQDLRITMVSSAARPGFDMYYDVIFENVGTVPMSGTVTVDLDTMVDYLQSSVTPTAVNGQAISWNFSNLGLFEHRTIRVEANVHPFVSLLGDTMQTTAIVNPIATDAAPHDNTFDLDQIITGAYDPNDKRVVPGWGNFGEVELGTEELTYTIRFQNTGTDTAFNIRITDVLPDELDPLSLDMLGASHPYSIEIEDQLVTWSFYDILLPDSGINQLGSNGYVTFKIKTVGTPPNGTQISNNASIYFDFNPPIITNDCYTTWTNFVGIKEQLTVDQLHIYPNPSSGEMTVDFGRYLTDANLTIYDLSGREVQKIEGIDGSSYRLELHGYSGTYLLRLLTTGSSPVSARIQLK